MGIACSSATTDPKPINVDLAKGLPLKIIKLTNLATTKGKDTRQIG